MALEYPPLEDSMLVHQEAILEAYEEYVAQPAGEEARVAIQEEFSDDEYADVQWGSPFCDVLRCYSSTPEDDREYIKMCEAEFAKKSSQKRGG